MPKPFLMHRPSGLYVRLLLPAVLRPLVGQRFLVRSLGDLRDDAARLAAACLGYALRKAAAAAAAGEAMDKKLLEAALAAAARGAVSEYKIDIPGVGTIEADGPEDHARALETLDKMKAMAAGLPARPAAAPVKAGPSLHEALDQFVAQIRRTKLAKATIRETEHSLALFRELVDDRPLADVGHDEMDAFEEALSHWPRNARVLPGYRGLDARAVVAKGRSEPDVPKIGWRSLIKHRDRLSVFFNHVVRKRQLPFNPAADRPRETGAAKYTLKHRAFRPEELSVIFDPRLREEHCARDAHFFWLPLMALFTGARLNEIAQLRLVDLEHFEGQVWGIHITPEAGPLKNSQSRRFVPLPERLLNVRLAAYAQDVKAAGFSLLFPGGSVDSPNGPGTRVSKWFNRTFLDKVCALDDPTLCFHSFRHTQQTVADRVGLSEAQVAPISGHALRSVQARHYIDKPTLPERQARLNLIADAMVLPRLECYMRGQFDSYFQRVRDGAMERAG